MNPQVVITGISKGIGKAIAQKFLAEGYPVVGTYNQTEPDRRDYGPKCQNLTLKKVDLTQKNDIIKFCGEIPAVQVLINNAGLGSKTVENYSQDLQEQDQLLLSVNALAPLWITQLLLPKLKQNAFAKIINIASVGGGIFHFPGFRLADGMSKAALTFMTKQIAAELVHTSVDVFAVCPGATETDMFTASALNGFTAEEKKEFVSSLPKGRLIQPKEIADLCFYLAQEGSTILHGAVIDSSLGLGVAPGEIVRKL